MIGLNMERKNTTRVVMVLGLGLLSCRKQPPQVEPVTSAAVPAAPNSQAVHDPGHPPIECPLAKHGIKPAHLRPFEDVDKYIDFLERPDRERWQRPDAIVAALGLTGNEIVADLGAGSGYFSFRFARALPRGSVVATDIEPEMVRAMHHKAMTEGIGNLRVVLGKAEDPDVPPHANLVFVCDVLHHVSDRSAWLGKLAAEMTEGARLVLIEFKEGQLPEGPPEDAKIPKATLISLVTHTGMGLESDRSDLLPYQSFLVFRKSKR